MPEYFIFYLTDKQVVVDQHDKYHCFVTFSDFDFY